MATTQAAGTERMNSDMTPSTPAMTDMPRRWPHGILGAIGRGLRGKCPACGEGRLFRAYLKVADNCPACGEELHHHRADDFPAYLVIIITGHILVPIVLAVETEIVPPIWLSVTLWPTLAFATALALLQPVKGAVVAVQWFGGLHGFEAARNARQAVAR